MKKVDEGRERERWERGGVIRDTSLKLKKDRGDEEMWRSL